MRRRTILRVGILGTGALISGCLGAAAPDGDGQDGRADDDPDVVAYGDLPAYDREFVDAAMDYHSVVWITEGDERTYVESTAGGWEDIEEPLVPPELGEDLSAVIAREKYLEIEGENYSFGVDVGHGPYGATYRAEEVEACPGETTPIEEFSGVEREILEALLDADEVFLAEDGFQSVSQADFFVDFDEVAMVLDEIFRGDGCLDDGDAHYAATLDAEFSLHSEGYELVRAERTDDGD